MILNTSVSTENESYPLPQQEGQKERYYSNLFGQVVDKITVANSEEFAKEVCDSVHARAREAFFREMILQLMPGFPRLFRWSFFFYHPSLIFPYLFRVRKVKTIDGKIVP